MKEKRTLAEERAEPTETIHVYIVPESEAQHEQPVVESTIHDASPILAQTDTQPLITQPQPTHVRLVPFIILAVNLCLVLAVFFIHIYPILTASATITIIPKHAVLTEHLTLSNVENRIFQPLTLTQSRTVSATGHGHQDAMQATGTITLYNAAIEPQTIDAGTLFIGSDGQHIVTDQTAVLPGASPPLEGQVTVSAHAVNTGAAGNIKAGDISGACCRENMFAYNSQFQGGTDERNYTLVSQEDIHTVVSSVVPTLSAAIHTSFQQEIQQGETLTPNQCSQNIVTDRNVGDEATHVTVTVNESCVAGAYASSDFQAKVQQALSQQAGLRLGKGYALSSYSQTSPLKTSIQHGTLVVSAIYQGMMIYQFSQHDLTTLRHQLAGKSRQQGIAMLSHLNGVNHLTLQIGANGTFPTDPTHIHIVFLIVS